MDNFGGLQSLISFHLLDSNGSIVDEFGIGRWKGAPEYTRYNLLTGWYII